MTLCAERNMNNRWEIIAWDGCGMWWLGYQNTRDGARRLRNCILEPGEPWRLPIAKIYDRKHKEFIT